MKKSVCEGYSKAFKYLLKGTDTLKSDHKEEYQFTENGKIFSYPEICIYDYL